jgi:phosphate:Na+ symporter
VTIVTAKYLDEPLIGTPTLALDRGRLEIGHVGEHVQKMVDQMMPTILWGDEAALAEMAKLDDAVDILHGKIVTYLGRVSRQSLSDVQSLELTRLMEAVNDLENIGDIIETDLVALGHKRIDDGVVVSAATQEVLNDIHASIAEAVRLSLRALVDGDERAARDVIAMKGDINRLVDAAAAHQAGRLVADEPNRLAAYSVEIDIIEKLKRIYYFAKRIAKSSVPAELSLKVE